MQRPVFSAGHASSKQLNLVCYRTYRFNFRETAKKTGLMVRPESLP